MPRCVNGYTKRSVAAAAAWRCAACKKLVGAYYEIDHVVPLHLGGGNASSNLQLLCCLCHKQKTVAELDGQGPWLSIAYCRVCKRTYSRYFQHTHQADDI